MFKVNKVSSIGVILALICISPILAFADSCPSASTLKKVGNTIIAYDSTGRKITYDDSSGWIQFTPGKIVFTHVGIVTQAPVIKGQLGCVYYNTQQGLGFNMIDFNKNNQVKPLGTNWQGSGRMRICVSNDPSNCQYTKN